MKQPNPALRGVLALFAVAALLIIVAIAGNTESLSTGGSGGGGSTPITQSGDREFVEQRDPPESFDNEVPEPVNFPRPIAYALAIAGAIAALYFLSRQRFSFNIARRRATMARTDAVMTEEEEAEAIAAIARDLIDELRDGDEPRYAIQRAYAAVEGGFGAIDLARKPAETPLKYLKRVFGKRRAAAPALTRLTELFQVARFSDQSVDESMRTEAIDALTEIRDHYQAPSRRKSRIRS